MFLPDSNSPTQQNVQEVKRQGIAGTIGKMAFGMLAYGIGMKVFRGMSFRANVGIGKLVASLTKPTSTLSKALVATTKQVRLSANTPAKKLAAGNFSRFTERLRKSTSLSLKRITESKRTLVGVVHSGLKEGRYSHRVMRSAERATRQLGMPEDVRLSSIIRNTDKFRKTGLSRVIGKLEKDAQYAAAKQSHSILGSLFSRSSQVDAGKLIRGRAFKYATFIGATGAFDYAMFNLMAPNKDKKWYSPKRLGEWAIWNTTADFAFRGAMPRARGLVHGAGRVIKRALKNDDIGKKVVTSVLSRADKIAHMAGPHAYSRSLDAMAKYNEYDHPGISFGKRMKEFMGEFRKIKTNIQKVGRKATASQDIVELTIGNLKKVEHQMDVGMRGAVRKQAVDSLNDSMVKNDPNRWLGRINEIFSTDIRSQKRSIGGKDAFRGSGLISADGKNYDIASVMPGNLVKKTFAFVHDNFAFHIPGLKRPFRPLSIFGLRPYISAQKNKLSLYTSKNHQGLIPIGVGIDERTVRNKLDASYQQIGDASRDILVNESKLAGEPLTKYIKENMDDLVTGDLAKRGTVDQRATMTKLAKENVDLEHQDKFITAYLDQREYVSLTKRAKAAENLRRGFMEIGDKESLMFVGDTGYYSVQESAHNVKTFQIGYDTSRNKYHQLVHIEGQHAGGMMNILAAVKGYKDAGAWDPSGRMIRAGGGASGMRQHRIVDPGAGPVRKFFANMFDILEIGNKPERSAFGVAGNYLTKLFHGKTLRNIDRSIRNNATQYMDDIIKSGEQHTFVGRLSTITNEANTMFTSKLIRKHNFIEEVTSYGKALPDDTSSTSTTMKTFFQGFKEGNMYVRGRALGETEFNTTMKKNAQRLIGARVELMDKSPYKMAIGEFESEDIKFLNSIIRTNNQSSFFSNSLPSGRANVEMYNNLTFRTYHKALEGNKRTQLMKHLQNAPRTSRYRKDIEMLSILPMIDTYKNIDIGGIDREVKDMLVTNTIDQMRKRPGAVNRLIDQLEPLRRPSSLRDNISHPNVGYKPVGITLSKNVALDDGGKLYGFFEQVVGSGQKGIGSGTGEVITTTQMGMMQALNAVNTTGNILGVGFNPDSVQSVADFGKRVVFKRVLPAIALVQAYRAADAFFDESKIFEGTQLGEGLSPLAANMIGQTRLAIAGVNDAMGVTATSRYLEDIMPGFVNSPLSHTVRGIGGPLAGLGIGFRMGGPVGGLIGGSIGAAMGIMSSGGPMGMIGKFDITKSREQLIEEYSGRRQVPVYKGSGWLFGMGPVAGRGITNFEPSWFHQVQSQYKYTDVLYGSKVERLLSPFDSDHYFEKHRVTRPYPVTENRLSGTPLLGNIIGFGGNLANEDEMQIAATAMAATGGNLNLSNFNFSNPQGIGNIEGGIGGTLNAGNVFAPQYDTRHGISGGRLTPPAILPNSPKARMQAAFEQTTDFMGLRGFVTESVITSQNDGMMPYEDVPKLESASWMASPFRHYWDANLGDMMGCVPDNTTITTNMGQVHIKNILPGDMVLCKDGWKKTIATIPRYMRNGEILHTLKYNGTSINATQDHEIYTIKRPICIKDKHAKCHPMKMCHDNCDGIKHIAKWIPISDVNVGDYVGIFINTNGKSQFTVDIGVENVTYSNNIVYRAGTCKDTMIVSEYIYENSYKYQTRDKLSNKTNIHRDICHRVLQGYRNNGQFGISRYHDIDNVEQFMWLVGLFVGDGSTGSNSVEIAHDNKQGREYHRRITRALVGTIFNAHIEYKDNWIRTRINNTYLARWFDEHIGKGVRNKRIPSFIWDMNTDARKAFICGMIDSDGHLAKRDSNISITTINETLANDLQILCLITGINATKRSRNGVHHVCMSAQEVDPLKQYSYKCEPYISNIKHTGKKRSFIQDDMLWIRVRDNVIGDNMVRVWDIVLDDDFHGFLADGIIVHNSNELIRRFIPKHGKHVNEVNPLSNQMPNWLAHSNDLWNLNKGDPYTSIKKGELRLPGAGYEATHDVRYRFPLETEYLGKTLEEQTALLTGNYLATTPDEQYDKLMRGPISKQVMEQMSMTNANVKEGRVTFNIQSNLSGKLDIVADGRGMNVRVVSHDTFIQIGNRPLPQHEADLNASLITSNMKSGTVIYFDAETGDTKSTEVYADTKKYYKDITQLMGAKGLAKDALHKFGPGIGINAANAYSRLDRLRILSDISPFSEEYQTTLRQVRSQKQAGLLSKWDEIQLQNMITQRDTTMDRYVMNDYKFNRGTAITDPERQYQQYISDNYNFAEKAAGGIWESLSHLKTPVHTKLLNMASPLEQYERMELYGKPIRDWGDPYGAFIRPMSTSVLSKQTTSGGALAMGMGGFVFGGPVGGVLGAATGAAYGTLHRGRMAIPGYRERERELTAVTDRIRYEKASMAYEATGSIEAKHEMEKTLTYQYDNASNIYSMFGAVPRHERAFMRNFANAGTIEERQRIREIVPKYVQPILEKAWYGTKYESDAEGSVMENYDLPSPEWKGWNANISTDDITTKMFERAGLDAHDVGLGWNSQIRKMRYTPGIPDSFSDPMGSESNLAIEVKSIVQSIVPGADVSVMPTGTAGISVSIV